MKHETGIHRCGRVMAALIPDDTLDYRMCSETCVVLIKRDGTAYLYLPKEEGVSYSIITDFPHGLSAERLNDLCNWGSYGATSDIQRVMKSVPNEANTKVLIIKKVTANSLNQ